MFSAFLRKYKGLSGLLLKCAQVWDSLPRVGRFWWAGCLVGPQERAGPVEALCGPLLCPAVRFVFGANVLQPSFFLKNKRVYWQNDS